MKGTIEDEIVGWHHRLSGHEFEQDLGDGEGQGSLVFCSSWGRKESDTTEQLSNNNSVATPSVLHHFSHGLFLVKLHSFDFTEISKLSMLPYSPG